MGSSTKRRTARRAVLAVRSSGSSAQLDRQVTTHKKSPARLDREIAEALAKRAYFKIGDVVLMGKYKSRRGTIVGFGRDKWKNPTVEIEPTPKGRKQNKIIGLYKIWRADVKEGVLLKQSSSKQAASAPRRRRT